MTDKPEFVLKEPYLEAAKKLEEEYGSINFKLVWMKPITYLKISEWRPETYAYGLWYFGNWSPDNIIKALTEGIPLPVTVFLMNVRKRKGHSPAYHQDGKNRAYWSFKLGVKKIPVLINDEAEKRVAKYMGENDE